MAKKKAELERAHARYLVLAAEVVREREAHDYTAALRQADLAMDETEDAIRYAQKFGELGVEYGVAVIATLACAPLVLRLEPIDRVQALLKSSRLTIRALDIDADAMVEESRARLSLCHHIYRSIETEPGLSEQNLRDRVGVRWREAEAVLDEWAAAGLVVPQGSRGVRSFFLATRRGAMVVAKCPACANLAEAPKAFFYGVQRCDRCRREVSFVVHG